MSIWSTIFGLYDYDQPQPLGLPYEVDYSLDAPRGGAFGVATAASFMDGLRFDMESPDGAGDAELVLDRPQVEALHHTLGAWLGTSERLETVIAALKSLGYIDVDAKTSHYDEDYAFIAQTVLDALDGMTQPKETTA